MAREQVRLHDPNAGPLQGCSRSFAAVMLMRVRALVGCVAEVSTAFLIEAAAASTCRSVSHRVISRPSPDAGHGQGVGEPAPIGV